MPYVCRATGHIVEEPEGTYCTRHGAPLITNCAVCGADWPPTWDEHGLFSERGGDFCAQCGSPAPWLSRAQLVRWLRDRLNDAECDPATRLELQEILDRVVGIAADDTKALAAWQSLRDRAPAVWELAKPVLSTLIDAGLKKYLGLG